MKGDEAIPARNRPPQLIPLFGSGPHVPALMARVAKGKPCPTCPGKIRAGSLLVCMTCHAVAPDLKDRVGRHALPKLPYDGRDGPPKAKKGGKGSKVIPAPVALLTAKERRQIARAATKAGIAPEVVAWIATAGRIEPAHRPPPALHCSVG